MLTQREMEDLPKWFVAYTVPNTEKRIQDKLDVIGIQSYLPLQEVIRQWSDRKRKIKTPLFPNYLFVYTSHRRRLETFAIKEIIRYVSFEGKAATIPNATLDSIKNILKEGGEVTVESCIKAGDVVEICRGPFTGTKGIVAHRNGKMKLIVNIEALQRSVAVNISVIDVVPI